MKLKLWNHGNIMNSNFKDTSHYTLLTNGISNKIIHAVWCNALFVYER